MGHKPGHIVRTSTPRARRARTAIFRTLRLGAGLAVVTGLLMVSATTAPAAVGDADLNVQVTGASASAHVTWVGRYEFRVTNFTLSDTACDRHPVNVRVEIKKGGETKGVVGRDNTSGCGSTAQLKDVSWNSTSGRPDSVHIRVCREEFFGDTCKNSESSANPRR